MVKANVLSGLRRLGNHGKCEKAIFLALDSYSQYSAYIFLGEKRATRLLAHESPQSCVRFPHAWALVHLNLRTDRP